MGFKIERNDITKVKADVIVNTANPLPTVGPGTDLQIYEAAGYKELLAEREQIGFINPGCSAATSSYKLKANGVKYIIHTVGTGWGSAAGKEVEILRRCYSTALNLAKELDCKTIAIPLLATGNYKYPKDLALKVASDEINGFLLANDGFTVKLIVFDSQSFLLSEKLHADIESFIDENYVDNAIRTASIKIDSDNFRLEDTRSYCFEAPSKNVAIRKINSLSVDEFISKEKEKMNFQNLLQKKIADKDCSNATIYTKANVDKKFFSKIISTKDYVPKKETVMAFGLALELPMEEFESFLASAGYAFKASSLFDTIIKYCILNRIYNLFDVNAILFDYDLPVF